MFRKLFQDLSAFDSRFWTPNTSRLNRCSKSGASDPLEGVEHPRDRKRILKAICAREMYANMELMALGLTRLAS